MARDTVIDRLRANAQKFSSKPALYGQDGNAWRMITWQEYWDRARKFGGGLIKYGHKPGGAVTVMGDNCPEWVIADVGGMMVRGVPAGIYQTSTSDQTSYIANHCEAVVFVIENKKLWDVSVAPIADGLKSVQRFVFLNDADKIKHEKAVSFEDFLKEGEAHLNEVDKRIDEIEYDDLATLIYTSGTTGPPKGVMLSQRNLSFTSKEAIELVGGLSEVDCNVSYLPLSHIAEQMFTIHIPLSAGSPVYFCADLKQIRDALSKARPTIFLGVPRVWEKFKTALEGRFAEATGLRKILLGWSRNVALKAGYQKLQTGQVSGMLGLQFKMASKILGKVHEGLGLNRLRVAVVGAAPIGLDVLEFFLSIGIPIHEVYGQSEDSGPTTFNRPKPGWTKLGTAGRPFPNIQVKIAEDGEILVKGDNVFLGYYKNKDATEETLVDGWLHSGDIGEFDTDGYLRITDRKKDLIITAGGKNVAPQNIEKLLRQIDGISQAVAIGDRRKFMAALLTLDPERAPKLAAERGWPEDLEALAKHEAFIQFVDAEIKQANEQLARYESIRKFTLLPNDFSIDGGELTPTQKIKRRVVNEKYGKEIEAFYEGLD
ncbi:MAG: long-chain fatty acid--CoA ligase [Myxococcales bacterium]|nr:long-chain fatty acid--CoA ligase [Myxococcales bacterium]